MGELRNAHVLAGSDRQLASALSMTEGVNWVQGFDENRMNVDFSPEVYDEVMTVLERCGWTVKFDHNRSDNVCDMTFVKED